MHLSPEKLCELDEIAYQIRRLSLEMITFGKWGHIGGAFSMAEFLSVLYFQAMSVKPDAPQWEDRDRLVLSKAHGSPALYAVLALRGFYPIEQHKCAARDFQFFEKTSNVLQPDRVSQQEIMF